MPYSSGVYSFPSSPGAFNPATTGGTADPASWNSLIADLKTALSTCLLKDGTQSVTANIPLNTNRLTGVGNAIALQDAATATQIQNSSLISATDTGAADAYAIALTPAITAYAVGQVFIFVATHANLTTTPKLAVNGLTQGTIQYSSAGALGVGDISLNGLITVIVQAVSAGTPTFAMVPNAPGMTTTAVTQSPGNNSTLLATTAYVDICRISSARLTNSLSGDVNLTNTGSYFTGPQVAQGTSGTWYVSATIIVHDPSGQAVVYGQLTDGTTVIASGVVVTDALGAGVPLTLSGYITSPAGNLRMTAKDITSTSGAIKFNVSGNSMDSTISAIRIV